MARVEAYDRSIHVPHPELRLILTGPRLSDGDTVQQGLNDPRVYMNLDSPPFPYTQHDWEAWFQRISLASQRCLEEWDLVDLYRQSKSPDTQSVMNWIAADMWVSTIREDVVTDTGTSRPFVGVITVERDKFRHVQDEAHRGRLVAENASRDAGDPQIEWEVGFWLMPQYHGRGVMPAALQTLFHQVLVPYMNVQSMTGTYFEPNTPSKKVFEKCGFQAQGLIPDAVDIAESKAGVSGKRVGLGVMRWERPHTL